MNGDRPAEKGTAGPTSEVGSAEAAAAEAGGDDVARRALEASERRHRLGAEHARRHLSLLVGAGDALAGALDDTAPAFAALGSVVVPMFADWFAIDVIEDGAIVRLAVDGDGARRGPVAGRGGDGVPHRHPEGERLVAAVLDHGRPEMVLRRPDRGGTHLQGLEDGHARPAGGVESMVVVPIRVRSAVVGAASFVTGGSRRGYRPSDRDVAAELADQIGVAQERVLLWHAGQKARADAEASERRLRAVVESVPLAILEADLHGALVWWNAAARSLVDAQGIPAASSEEGARDQVRRSDSPRPGLAPGVDEVVRQILLRAHHGESVVGEPVVTTGRDGSAVHLSVFSAPLHGSDGTLSGVLAVVEDVTERLTMVEQFHQAERLGAMARLAGGIAHDFNNLLTVVLGSCEILLRRMAPTDPLVDEVVAIQGAGKRAADLTSQLLSIGYRRPIRPQVLDPHDVLVAMEPVLCRVVGEGVTVEVIKPDRHGRVLVEPAELERALLNLAVNARDAMPGGGQLWLGSQVVGTGGGPGAGVGSGSAPGSATTARLWLPIDGASEPAPEVATVGGAGIGDRAMVQIWVRDSGTGMDAHTAEHCFDPFFTTKPRGEGTGLGLAGVHSSVTQAGGTVAVTTRPGAGTTVTMSFPLVPDEVISPSGPEVDGGGIGTGVVDEASDPVVLVVDDDPDIRRLAVQALIHRGYLVVAAAGGAEALDAVAAATDQVDLLVTDVAMPGMSGLELAARLVAHSPKLPVLFMSGNAGTAGLAAGADILMKPFTPEELGRRADAALRRQATTRSPR